MCSLMSETWTHVFLVKSSLILKPYNMADRRNVDTLAKVLEVHTTPTPGYERNILGHGHRRHNLMYLSDH